MAVVVDRKQYLIVFLALTLLTGIEVGLVFLPIAPVLIVTGLLGLAVGKAAVVAYYYMHLNHETGLLRKIVSYCFAIPVVYAIVLISEAAWRML
jgi:cytochrome c oxidase subunit IV